MRRWLALALVAAGCATGERGGAERARLADQLQAALVEDAHGESRAALVRWRSLLDGDLREEQALAMLALTRIDAIVSAGVEEAEAARLLATLDEARLPERARRALALVRARIARMSGDEERARSLEREAGCGLPWRASPPLGRLPRLDLARPVEATAAAQAPTRARGCRVVAVAPDGRPAAMPISLDLTTRHAGDIELWVASDEPYRVWADGVAGELPDEDAPWRRQRRYRITLPAGAHRLSLAGAAPYGRLELEVALSAPAELGGQIGEAVGTRTGGARIAELLPRPVVIEGAPGSAARIATLYLDAADAEREGDGTRAREAARPLVEAAPRFAPALELAARIAAADATVPQRFAHDRARRLLDRALAADPSAARVRLESGRLALERERARDALQIAEAAPDPHALRVALLRAEVYRARGRDGEVRAALEAVPHALADACALQEALVTDDRLRHRPPSLERARRVSRCRAGATALGDALRQRGELDAAIAEYRRVIEVDPLGESARAALGDALLERRDQAGAIAVYEELLSLARRSASYRLRLVDALVAAGRDADARARLDEGIALDPESAELVAARRSLARPAANPDPSLDLDRIDGRAAIAAFEAAGRRYDGPAVFVLDRTVTRVYPTGSQRTLTHNIVKVLAKDGLDRWGEWHLPANAELLALWAWKPGGSRLEPEEVPEKESISIPGLAVGDYVEVEYIERASPPAAFPQGFLAERFYFGSHDAPLDRSEYLVVAPRALPVEIDRQGAPPPMIVTERDEPGGPMTVRSFVAHTVAELAAEPSAVTLAEYMPSVRASARVSAAAWRDYLVDLAWGTRRRDPALASLVAELTRGARDDADRLQRLDSWVRRNIKSGEGLAEVATAVLARREGNRATLLAALAQIAGLPCRMLLARSRRAPAIASDLESYDSLVLEIAGQLDDVRYRHGRPGALPPYLRGALAMPLVAGAPATPIELRVTSSDRRAMTIAMTLAKDGSGEVRVEERLSGWPALEWRESLDHLPADRVRPQFEQHTLGYFFPGATLKELSWEAADRDDVPFVVRYSFSAPGLARRLGDALVLPAPFAAQLRPRYLTGDARTTPVFVDEVAATELSLAVQLPEGAAAVAAAPVSLDGAPGRFVQRTRALGRELTMRSEFSMPLQRVPLAAWIPFVAWIEAVDRAEAQVAVIQLAPAPSRR